LDCELMPWSAKAQELLRDQYAAVGAAGKSALPAALSALTQAAERLQGDTREQIEAAKSQVAARLNNIHQFIAAYRRYCWPVGSIADLKLAPFHVLASEGQTHVHQNHLWQMETLRRLCGHDSQLLSSTSYKLVDLTEPSSEE